MSGPNENAAAWNEILDSLHSAENAIRGAIDHIGQVADVIAESGGLPVTVAIEDADCLSGVTTLPDGEDVG